MQPHPHTLTLWSANQDQIVSLKDKLEQERVAKREFWEEIASLRDELQQERVANRESREEIVSRRDELEQERAANRERETWFPQELCRVRERTEQSHQQLV